MRIAGIEVPEQKALCISLSYIYGIGRSTALAICKKLSFNPNLRFFDLSESDAAALSVYITENYVIEGDLRRDRAMSIKRLSDIGCYRGIRHRKGLPVRGQRTRANARTRKGRARIPVAGKKKAV